MILLGAQDLALYAGERRVFSELSLSLYPGQRLGLVGRGGAGKSSLLEILAGRRAPHEGRVLRAPGLRLGYAPQDWRPPGGATVWEAGLRALASLRALEAELRTEEARLEAGEVRLEAWTEALARFEAAGGYEGEARLAGTLASLGLGDRHTQLAHSLSGGERARLALALVLSEAPELLLLDEPSQHLDLAMRRWLRERLAHHSGALLLVSHDRALLEAVCTDIALLEDGRLRLYGGGYRAWRSQTVTERRQEARQEVRARREEAKLAARHEVGARRKSLPQPARGGAGPQAPGAAGRPLTLGTDRAARGDVLQAAHLSKTVAQNGGERVLVRDASLRLGSGDRLALVGPNGSGKTTLLKMLALELGSDHPEARVEVATGVRLLYLDQEGRGLDPERSPLAQVGDAVGATRAASLLALAGLPHARWESPAAALSAGERARASLALATASEAGLLLLDEPNNHLDLDGTERLEAALLATKAAVILVSHDEALVRRVATRVMALEDGELVEFRGGLEGYFKGTRRLEPEGPESFPARPDEREGENDEARLEALELELQRLGDALMDPLRLSERERVRLGGRERELLDELSLLYDRPLPRPLPRQERREGPVRVWLEEEDQGSALLLSNAGLRLRLLGWGAGHLALGHPSLRHPASGHPASEHPVLGHFALAHDEDRCALPWAACAAVRAAARLAFESLGVGVLQLQSPLELAEAGFARAGEGWWLQSRRDFEEREGYVRERPSPTRPQASRASTRPRASRRRGRRRVS